MLKGVDVPGRVSTHSRAEAAASLKDFISPKKQVSTHSRAEAAANGRCDIADAGCVSTHSRAEAAAPYLKKQEKSAD